MESNIRHKMTNFTLKLLGVAKQRLCISQIMSNNRKKHPAGWLKSWNKMVQAKPNNQDRRLWWQTLNSSDSLITALILLNRCGNQSGILKQLNKGKQRVCLRRKTMLSERCRVYWREYNELQVAAGRWCGISGHIECIELVMSHLTSYCPDIF